MGPHSGWCFCLTGWSLVQVPLWHVIVPSRVLFFQSFLFSHRNMQISDFFSLNLPWKKNVNVNGYLPVYVAL